MKKMKVSLGKRSYDIIIGYKIMPRIGRIVERLKLGRNAVIITNPAIYSLHKNAIQRTLRPLGFKITAIKIPDREGAKSNREVVRLIESIVRIDKGEGIFIVAFGGGVVGDVAGFVASIYKRGIPYIQIPTTLLAQVDSAIGGKVAIDLSSAKNMVGAFYQPRLVASDIYLLRSLPLRHIRSGLAEIIKYGIIEDRRLFEFLEENIDNVLKLNKECLEYIICRSSSIKARAVGMDEYDTKGVRARLNYGHTIGHAIETATRYSKLYSHGEAVAIGMILAAEISRRLGILEEAPLLRIKDLIKKAGLPTKIKGGLNINKIMRTQSHDKKIIHGVNRFVLPLAIGRTGIYEDIPRKVIREVITSCVVRSA